MSYIVVKWRHSNTDEPVLLFSELDAKGWEIRKVEVFRNGIADFADANHNTGLTGLGIMPVPSLDEVAADPQFQPQEITKEDFERVWRDALERKLILPIYLDALFSA